MKPSKPSPGADTELASDWYNYGLAMGAKISAGSPPYSVDHDTRLAALQSALEVYAIRFKEQADRIEALKTALRACVQYHVKAAADCRAIAAVNQNNDLGEDSLTAAIDHDIAAEDIGDIARAALAKEQDQ